MKIERRHAGERTTHLICRFKIANKVGKEDFLMPPFQLKHRIGFIVVPNERELLWIDMLADEKLARTAKRTAFFKRANVLTFSLVAHQLSTQIDADNSVVFVRF